MRGDAIAECLFGSPQYIVGNQSCTVERLPQCVLFNVIYGATILGRQGQVVTGEDVVEERDAQLQPKEEMRSFINVAL